MNIYLEKIIAKIPLFFLSIFFISVSFADNSQEAQSSKTILQKLVDSYVSSSKTDETLKHLLDARMYLSDAEHDLLISHNKKGAQDSIENTLNYIQEAQRVAKPDITKLLSSLAESLRNLKQRTIQLENSGNDNETDELLANANTVLLKAKKNASEPTLKDIDVIIANINTLRKKIEHENLREHYESAMHTLRTIISKLK